jgi:mRNA interferase MazF
MLRGEVRLVDLDPTRGAEASKRRPAVIVTNDAANSTAARLGRGVVTVVPITSNVQRVYPFQLLLLGTGGLPRDAKAQAEQVRSIAAERVGRLLGQVPPRLMASLDDALRLHQSL